MSEALQKALEQASVLGAALPALVGPMTGFRHAHEMTPAQLLGAAELFRQHDYILEMLTCLDLRQSAQCMRLVYTFNVFGPSDRYRLHVDLAPTRPWTGPTVKAKGKAKAQAGAEATAVAAPGQAGSQPVLPETMASLVQLFPAADWFEREVYDMFGVRFIGHPDLKRILLPDDADFHALLKDFGRMDQASAPQGT